ncbi:hypothetical protein [Phenylobacterium sp.]|uniref:hypothetical protein n=1 Tax=Phenylobacterium sp. TaxID=1871053 RepID=UPI0039199E4E
MASAGSPSTVISPAQAAVLQERFALQRAIARGEFEVLRAGGAFIAPEHLRPGLRAELGLGEPLRPDDARAEAG